MLNGNELRNLLNKQVEAELASLSARLQAAMKDGRTCVVYHNLTDTQRIFLETNHLKVRPAKDIVNGFNTDISGTHWIISF